MHAGDILTSLISLRYVCMEYECDIVNFENLCWQFCLFTSRYAISVADDRLSFSLHNKTDHAA